MNHRPAGRFALLAVTALFLSACASQGTHMDTSKLEQMKPGVSTIADARTLLGEPQTVTRKDDGTTVLAYSFSSSKMDPKGFIPIVGTFVGKGPSQDLEATRLTFDRTGHYVSYSRYAMKQ
jgi:hypothetical protein